MLARIGFGMAAIALVILTLPAIVPVVLDRFEIALWEEPSRPANVPDDAIRIPYIAKSRLWARCWTERSTTRCQIFDEAGAVIHDDVFLTYENKTPVTASELSLGLVPERSGPYYLWLKSGTILLPQTDFETHRRTARVEALGQGIGQ